MSKNRFTSGLLLGMLVSAAAAAVRADHFDHLVPPSPSHNKRLDLFAPPDLSEFGSGPPTNEGYFFNADFIQWNIQAPDAHTIGFDTSISPPTGVVTPIGLNNGDPIGAEAFNGLSTVEFETRNDLKSGRRFETGWVEENHGALLSFFTLRDEDVISQGPLNSFRSGLLVIFDDSTFGPDPPFGVVFSEVKANNIVKLSGIELMGVYRYDREREPYSGQFEWLYGVRYMNWDEEYNVSAVFSADINKWNTGALNQLIGPQFGFRYFKQNRRWAWAMEARCFVAANIQHIDQQVEFSDTLVDSVDLADPDSVVEVVPTSHNHADTLHEFSPSAELRLEGSYTLTRRVRMRAGWSGMFVSNLARPSAMVDYNFSGLGILADENRQNTFINGFHMGVEINH